MPQFPDPADSLRICAAGLIVKSLALFPRSRQSRGRAHAQGFLPSLIRHLQVACRIYRLLSMLENVHTRTCHVVRHDQRPGSSPRAGLFASRIIWMESSPDETPTTSSPASPQPDQSTQSGPGSTSTLSDAKAVPRPPSRNGTSVYRVRRTGPCRIASPALSKYHNSPLGEKSHV